MRRLIVYALFLLINVTFLYGQEISVLEEEQLTTSVQGMFCFPHFAPEGDKLALTSGNYKGLWILNIESKSLQMLNELPGAGYQPVFSPDGSMVYFRNDRYDRGRKLSAILGQSISGKSQITIEPFTRNLSSPKMLTNGEILYQKGETLNIASEKVNVQPLVLPAPEPVVFIENRDIALVQGTDKNILMPVGEGHYVWPSLSPDKTRILFTKTGVGTYVSDLEGNILADLGYANAPRWSPDGEWVVYMVDRDDGHTITSSHIYAASVDEKNRYQLTRGERIDLYPDWSPRGNQITFASSTGQIYLLTLSVTP
jgi:Tol biopolymer transport system component